MPFPVYTQRLFWGNLPLTFGLIYAIPAGAAVVLRDIELYNASSGPARASVTIQDSSGAPGAWVVNQEALPALTTYQWQGRVALEEGNEVWGSGWNSAIPAVVTAYVFAT